MKNLSRVLILKIGLTIVLWWFPLLFWTVHFLRDGSLFGKPIGFPLCDSDAVFLKLLGMAYGALVVGYVFGLIAARQGRYPKSTVWVGIVSNGGAFLILVVFKHGWDIWTGLASVFMWVSLAATGLITAGLIAFGPCGRNVPPERSVQHET